MTADRFRIPVEQLEDQTRVARPDQVVLVGDGAAPPAVAVPAEVDADAGDGE